MEFLRINSRYTYYYYILYFFFFAKYPRQHKRIEIYTNIYKMSFLCFILMWLDYIRVRRISVIFKVRSAKVVKITDKDLLKRLGLMMAVVGLIMLIRTLVDPPYVIVGRTADNLKTDLCPTGWWDRFFSIRK